MKEGLRSGKQYAKVENSEVSLKRAVVVVERKGQEESHVGSESGGEKVTDLVLSGPEPDREPLGLKFEEKSEDLDNGGDEGHCEKVEEVADSGTKRKGVDDGVDIGNVGLGRKKVKEEHLSDEVPVVRRVLRSSSLLTGGCDKVKTEDVLDWKIKDNDKSDENKWSEEEKVKCDGQLDSGVGKKSERKRGRPPLVRKVEGDSSGLKKLKVKLGRPRKVEKEERGQLASDGGLRKKLKRKRGRPPKVQESSKPLKLGRGRPRKLQESPVVLKLKRGRPPKIQERNVALKLKLGRPRKAEKQENNASASVGRLKKLKGKRGRPLKVQQSNEVLKGDVDKEREVRVDEGRQPLHSILRPSQQDRMKQSPRAYLSNWETMQNGEDLNVKRLSLSKNKAGADLETKGIEASSGKSPETVNAVGLKCQKGSIKEGKTIRKDGEVEPCRSMVKQSVREKIIELLLSAGWTIEHRPRAGKDYADAVYVSPEGKTHWSVTLAYKMLQQHYEDGDGVSKVYKAGFKFIPIPSEEFGILKRVVVKKREGKKKLKLAGGKGSNTINGVISKMKNKKKLVGKSRKGRPKGKSLPHERDNSAGTQHKRMPVLFRDHNQQKTQNGKRRTLLVRNSMEDADSDSDGYIPYAGKRTVLAWMIDLGTVSLDGKVHYMNRRKTRVMLEGRITRDGILCDCCSETVTISKFGTHAGNKLCEPFNNIYLESGTSLVWCLLDSWNKQQESECKGFHYVDVNGEDPNDDTCGICGDGGALICCDSCPSTFHQSCLDIQKFPSGDWHCVFCSCKFCGMAGGRECQGNDNDDSSVSEFFTCQLCEEKFHRFCSRANDAGFDPSSSNSFCGKKCQQLSKKLKKLIGVKHDLEEGFSWTLIRRSDVGSSTSVCDIPQSGDVAQKIECNSKLAVALSIMDECFLPMVDHRSGINLIHNIVYNFGSNFNRLNYSGFLTVILERSDEIVCAASIRIHGDQLAEMPFIGTRYMYRRQGMCRRLLSVIESVLCSLDVERLVIPAISELTETWTSVFGFRPLEVSSKQKMKNMNMLVFPGIHMLQKPLLKIENAGGDSIVMEGPRASELEHQINEVVLCKTDEMCTKGCASNIPSEANAANGAIINEPTVKASSQLPDGSLNDADRKCLVESGVAHDNLEDKNKTIVKSSDNLCERIKEFSDYQNVVCGLNALALDQKGVELDRQSNQCGISDEESKSLVLPCAESEATKTGGSILCASRRENTESADCEIQVEDCTVTDTLNSHDEGFTHLSTEINTSEPQEKTLLSELKVSVENVVCHESRTRVQMSNGDSNFKCHHSENCLEEEMLESHEMQNDSVDVLQTSVRLDENVASPACYVSQNPDTSKVSVDEIHPIVNQEAEDDFKDSVTPLPVDCSYSDIQSNGLKTHEVLVSAPVDSNCDPSCVAYIDSNGLCKSKDVISSSLGVMVDGIQD